MIAELIAGTYDSIGRKVIRPDIRRKGPHPTFPFGRYMSQPISVKCTTLQDIRRFLSTCRFADDKKQFGKDDYWQPPEQFERTKMGDCDCFALWTWRQLLEMGYSARFVAGRAGRFEEGHAWITFTENDQTFLLDPTRWMWGEKLPRLSTLSYVPKFSVEWDGKKINFYEHEECARNLGLLQAISLFPEWLILRAWLWLRVLFFWLPRFIWRKTFGRIFKRGSKVSAAAQESLQ